MFLLRIQHSYVTGSFCLRIGFADCRDDCRSSSDSGNASILINLCDFFIRRWPEHFLIFCRGWKDFDSQFRCLSFLYSCTCPVHKHSGYLLLRKIRCFRYKTKQPQVSVSDFLRSTKLQCSFSDICHAFNTRIVFQTDHIHSRITGCAGFLSYCCMQVETVGCIIVCHLRTVHPLRIIICPCINPRTFECLDSGAASVCLVHPVKLGTAVLRIRSCCKKSAVFIKSHCKYFSACLEEFFSLSGPQVNLCEITVLPVWRKCQSVHDAFLIIKCHTDNLLVISQAVISKCHIIWRVVCCNAVKHTGIVISIEAAVIILSGPQRISTDHTCCDLGGFYIVVVDLHPVVIVLACIIIRTQKRFHLSCRRINIYFQSIRKRSCYRFSTLTFFITDRNAHRCLSFSYKMHLAKTVYPYHIFIAAVVNFGIRCRPDRRGHTFELHTATGKCRQRIGVGNADIFYLNISGFRFVARYRKQNGLLRTCFCRKISKLNTLCCLISLFPI